MNYSARRIADAADAVIPDHPIKHPNHARMRQHREMLLVGIIWEMSAIKPSQPELEAIIGCSHTSAGRWLDQWLAMPWRDRYGWLRLVEGRLANETHTVDAALL